MVASHCHQGDGQDEGGGKTDVNCLNDQTVISIQVQSGRLDAHLFTLYSVSVVSSLAETNQNSISQLCSRTLHFTTNWFSSFGNFLPFLKLNFLYFLNASLCLVTCLTAMSGLSVDYM